MKTKCYCVICGKFIGNFYPSVIRKTCSKKCYLKLQSLNKSDKNNPNYKSGKYIKNICKKCGVSIDPRSTYCQKCRPNRGHKHTEKSKKKIGQKSKEKFTDKYKKQQRKVMVKRGYWIPLKDKDPYLIYRDMCNWVEKMWDQFPNNEKLKKYGVFNMKTNSKGCVRDHIYSRKFGFENGIFPIMIRHPANCQILLHTENVSKRNKNEITLNQLIERLKCYNGDWFEQKECLMYVRKYENGERFSLKGVIKSG